MKLKSVNIQPDLFGRDAVHPAPTVSQTEPLARLVEALLREIAAALVVRERGDDQDHG